MKKELHHYIKPGLVHFMAYPALFGEGPIVESVKAIAADPFFEVIEVTWMKDPAVRAEAVRIIKSSGLEAKYGAQPRLLTQKLNLNSADRGDRTRAVEEIFAAIDEAVEMGISDLGLLSGPHPGPEGKEAAMDLLEKSLVEICQYAASREVNIILEVFDYDVDKKALIGPAADAAEIAERVTSRCSNFGLMVDLSHIPLTHESPAEALQPTKAFVKHIHIGNAYSDDPTDPAYGDKHPRFGYPGGANDVPEIVAFLKELFAIGYLDRTGKKRMPISFEISCVGDDTPDLIIANAKRKLRAAWSQLQLD